MVINSQVNSNFYTTN